MGRLLSRADRPHAVFCANDLMAFGALDALRAHSIQPEDRWVIGYDDVDMAAWDSFSLTTVRQPSREMARVGAKMLLERIHGPANRHAGGFSVRPHRPGQHPGNGTALKTD